MCEISQVTYIFVVHIKGFIIPWHTGILFTYGIKQFLVEIKVRSIANFSRL